jgi:hypothetical protein
VRRVAAARRAPRAAIAALAAALLAGAHPAPAAASSPWLPEPGIFVVRAKWLQQSSDEAFCPILSRGIVVDACESSGEREPYPSGGNASDRSIVLEAEAGILRRVALDAKFSYKWLAFDALESGRADAPPILNDVRSTGPGDLALGARLALIESALRAAPYATVKFPLTDSIPTDATRAFPLDERQIDLEMGAHLGVSLWPRPIYARGRCAYRVRAENTSTGRDPGNEVIAEIEVGVRARRALLIKCGLDGMVAEPTHVASDTLATVEPRKRVLRATPGIAIDLGENVALDASAYVPIAGSNYPAGTTFAVGISVRRDARRLR